LKPASSQSCARSSGSTASAVSRRTPLPRRPRRRQDRYADRAQGSLPLRRALLYYLERTGPRPERR
jgi:hypothetical protein